MWPGPWPHRQQSLHTRKTFSYRPFTDNRSKKHVFYFIHSKETGDRARLLGIRWHFVIYCFYAFRSPKCVVFCCCDFCRSGLRGHYFFERLLESKENIKKSSHRKYLILVITEIFCSVLKVFNFSFNVSTGMLSQRKRWIRIYAHCTTLHIHFDNWVTWTGFKRLWWNIWNITLNKYISTHNVT